MKLYGSPTSPYVRKARVLIHEKSMPVEFVIEDPWTDDSPIIVKNPLSKIPVLEIGADSYMFESQLVVHYLDHSDGKSLTPRDPAGYWQSQWWQSLGNGIIDAGITRAFENRRPEDKQMPEKKAREEQRIDRAIDAVRAVVPHQLQQTISREHVARALQQRGSATSAARRQVAETVERMRDVGEGIPASRAT